MLDSPLAKGDACWENPLSATLLVRPVWDGLVPELPATVEHVLWKPGRGVPAGEESRVLGGLAQEAAGCSRISLAHCRGA